MKKKTIVTNIKYYITSSFLCSKGLLKINNKAHTTDGLRPFNKFRGKFNNF